MSRSKPPPRFYVSEPIHAHGVCLLPPGQSHHLTHVLRLAAGDAVVVEGNERLFPMAPIDPIPMAGDSGPQGDGTREEMSSK